jgi:colicin import membrane protein
VAAELKQILLAKAAIVKRKKEALEKQKAVKEAEAGRVAQEKKVRRRKERKAELAKQLAADKAASDAKASEAAAQALKNALRVYTGRILRDVQAAWREPDGMPADLKTVLRVKQAANGKVESVEIDSSSGNSVFDRSAEQAVRRASPLPLPGDERLFKQFIKFTFKPPGA